MKNLYPGLNHLSYRSLNYRKADLEYQKEMIEAQLKLVDYELERREPYERNEVEVGQPKKYSDEELAAIIKRIMDKEGLKKLTMTEIKKLTGQKTEKIMPALDELIISGQYVKLKGGGIKRTY